MPTGVIPAVVSSKDSRRLLAVASDSPTPIPEELPSEATGTEK